MIRSWVPASWLSSSSLLKHAALPLLLGVLSSTAAQAQGFGPDPFQPYNSQYAPFVTPVAPGPLDYGYYNGPGRGVRGANQFQDYLETLQTSAAGARAGGAGVGVPYYASNRAYDQEFGRVYQPNKNADQRFEDNQTSVNRLYFDYLREKDPKKRAEIFRSYNRARSRADRDLASPRAGLATPSAARSGRREGRSAATDTAIRSKDRDLLSAPPLGTDTTRPRARSSRSGTDSSFGPAPSPLGGSRGLNGSGSGASPSQVLDRALRSDRSRLTPRPRVPAVDLEKPPTP